MLDHAIRKWTGLIDKNLKKHDMVAMLHYAMIDRPAYKDEIFHITTETCTLCIKYYPKLVDIYAEDGEGDDIHDDINDDCVGCPLFISLGNKRCDRYRQPYESWKRTGNPLPMIDALKKAKLMVRKVQIK